jgi:hypothetical protein
MGWVWMVFYRLDWGVLGGFGCWVAMARGCIWGEHCMARERKGVSHMEHKLVPPAVAW